MDWKETLLTDDFRAYRKAQAKEVAKLIHVELKKNANSDYLNGLLDMANRLMKLPSKLIKDEKLNMELSKLLTEDLTDLTIELVRERLKGE